MANLKQLGLALVLYANEHAGRYPPAHSWCDLLKDSYADPETFRCPDAEVGPCNYAMNPNAELTSSPQMVVLFETKRGWNQFGGLEILTFENHKGKGCNVLFNDCKVEFVTLETLERLGERRWKGKQSQ